MLKARGPKQADGPSDTSALPGSDPGARTYRPAIVRPLNLFAVGPAAFDVDKARPSIFAASFPTSGSWAYRGRFTN